MNNRRCNVDENEYNNGTIGRDYRTGGIGV